MRRGLAGANGALLAAAGILVGASLFFGGGSSDGPVAWIGAGAVLVALVAGAAALWGLMPAPAIGKEGLAFFGPVVGFVLWNGVSILWSAAPDRSWSYFNRGVAYVALALVGAFVGSIVAPRAVAWLAGALVASACLWALAGKAVPALYEDGGRFARLRSPLAYWNALALVVAFGLPLALWVATSRGHPRAVRAAAVTVLYALLVALVLTYSRGGALAAVVAVAAWLALTEDRVEGIAATVLAALGAAPVLAVALSLPGVADDFQPHRVRVHDGAWFAAAFLLGAAAVFAASLVAAPRVERRPLSPTARRLVLRLAAAVAAAVLVLGGALVLLHGGGSGDVVGQNAGRFGSAASNNRWSWWKEAWHGFEDRPIAGTGAASFALLHLKLRSGAQDVTTEPHSLPLQFAVETGLVGLALAAAATAAALLGAASALRRLKGAERAAAAAMAAILPAFIVHGSLDYDWDFIGVCGPLFFLVGVLLAAGRAPVRARRRPLWAAAAVLLAWTVLYSIAAPRVAAARVDDAYAQIERGSVDRAIDSAKNAHSLDPLSIEPLHAWAAAEERRGRLRKARELYVRAVDLQPLNWDTWYELGRFEGEVLADRTRSQRDLERARELDPWGPARTPPPLVGGG